MFRLLLFILATVLLSACTHLPKFSGLLTPVSAKPAPAETGQYSFAWRLSGDREVAPLQVFDDGQKTWLQFPEGQTVPAIFQRTRAGDILLDHRRQGPYVILSGVWPSLVLRGGSLQSRIDRVVDPDPVSVVDGGVSLPHEQLPLESLSTAPEVGLVAAVSVAEELPPLSATDLTQASFSDTVVEAEPSPVTPLPLESLLPYQATPIALGGRHFTHSVSPQDKNLRSALMRWATAAGWTFEPEHWAVDADIPIVGSATFDSHFKLAVQDLVASTELADRPLQPCFYSNQVLRIVPYAQTCDRSAGVVAS